jgi:ABC-type transport system substrate-binding protein
LPADHIISNFAAAGYPFYLDPRGKEMGDGAKSFQFDPAEAKKLLSAAGHSSPISLPFTVPAVGNTQHTEALAGGISAIGDFKFSFQAVNFQQVFIPQYQNQKGDFKGIILLGQAESPDYDWVDRSKRNDILKDFQRYMGTKMYIVPMPGQWKTFTLSQPWVGNFGAFLPWLGPSLGGAGPSQTSYTYYWSDDSRRKS